jgi:sulfur-carrier protein
MTPKFQISLQYFASLREKTGKSHEALEVAQGTKVRELYQKLKNQYNLNLEAKQLRAAVNDNFVNWEHQLQSGDDIVFIPPVGGG